MSATEIKKSSVILLLLGTILVVSVSILVLPTSSNALTGVPRLLSHQGRLLDSDGNLLGGAGAEYCFRFSIYDDANTAGGVKLWPTGSPSAMDVVVRNGVFNASIGDTASGGDQLDFDFNSNREVYLQVEVAAQTGGSCGDETFDTLSPRQRIQASGYTMNAATVGGFIASQSADLNEIPVLANGDLVLGDASPAIRANGSSTLTLQEGVSGNLQFFDTSSYISSTGSLVLAGNASVSGNIELSGFVSSNLIPRLDNAYTLGDATQRWANLFASNASVSGALEVSIASVSQLYVGGSLFTGIGGRPTSNSLDFDEFVDAMTLDATTTVAMAGYNYAFTGTGNVGIGTSNPTVTLDIRRTDSSTPVLRVMGAGDASNYSAIGLVSDEATDKSWAIIHRKAEANNLLFEYFNGSTYLSALALHPSGNIGVGSTNPQYKLDVNGAVNATNLLINGAPIAGSKWTTTGSNIYYNTGNVGVGTTNPTARMTVVATSPFDGLLVQNSAGPAFTLYDGTRYFGGAIAQATNNYSNVALANDTILFVRGAASNGSLIISSQNATGDIKFTTGVVEGDTLKMVIKNDGNVGIGTTAPTAALNIVGGLMAASPDANGIYLGKDTPNDNYGIKLVNTGGERREYIDFANQTGINFDFRLLHADGRFMVMSSTSPNYPLTITSAGNIGLGANLNPETTLEVIGAASASSYFGAGLTDCDLETQALGWDATTGRFSCMADAGASGGIVSSDSLDFDEFVDAMTLDATTSVSLGGFSYGVGPLAVRVSGASISSDFGPKTDAVYNLGSSTRRFKDIFVSGASLHMGTSGNEAIIGYDISGDALNFKPDGTNTLMSLQDAGNVGIGTTSTAGRLHIVPAAAGSSLFLDKYDNTNGGEMTLDGNTKTWHLGEASGLFKVMRYGANNGSFESNDFSITTVGNVGIGTTTADTKLEVAGAASASAYFGAGLTECTNDTTEKLLWNSSTGRFSCGTDQSGVSLTGWQLVGSIVSLYNSTDQVGVGTGNLNGGIKMEVVGTASISGGLYMGLPTGNLGVGTTGPGARIEVAAGGAANGLLISGASTNGLRVTTSNNANNSIFNVTNSANNASWLTVNANGQVIMNGAGNVGIGNTSPETKLDVAGTASVSSLLVAQFASVSGNLEVMGYASASRTFGSGLTSCNLSGEKLLWDSATGQFSCGVDQTSSGGASIGTSTDVATFTNVSSLSFAGAHFNLSYPAGGLVTLNWGAGGPASLSQDETVTGWWTFGSNVSVSGGLEVVGVLKGGATTLSSLTVNGQSNAVNASVSGTFETATLKATTLTNSTGTLTINAHTLGGLVLGNGQSITGLNQITTAIGSASGTFEALTLKTTTLGADGVLTLSPTARLQISGSASVSNNFEIIGVASASTYYGAGLSSCIGGSEKLLWENGVFSCGVDQSGSGGGALIGFREGFAGGFNNFGSISFDAGKFTLDTANADVRLNLAWGTGGPASLSQDESVTGHWVFDTGASVTGDFELTNRLKTVFASVSNALEITGYASSSKYFGGGLLDCDDTNSKLVWTASGSSAGRFSCSVDQAGGSTGWSADTGYVYTTTGTDNVGIGTTTPTQKVQIKTTGTDVLEYGLQVQNTSNTVGRTTGVLFSVEGTNNNGKGALVFTRTGSFGVGDFHFLQNTTADTSNAAIGQEVLTIKSNGNVGIGSTAPTRLLDVDGAFEANSTFGSGLSTCSNGTTDKLLYNSSTGLFSCGTDQSGASASGWQDGGASVTLFTDTDSVGIGTQNVSGAKLEVAGIASVSNLIVPTGYVSVGTTTTGTARLFVQGVVSGGVNQPVFAVASASGRVSFAVNESGSVIIGHDSIYGESIWNTRYNQINRSPASIGPQRSELNATDDLFIAGDLEIDGVVDFGSNASITGNLEMATGAVLYLANYDEYPDVSAPVLSFAGDSDTGIGHEGVNGPNKIFFVNAGAASGVFTNTGDFVLRNGVTWSAAGNAKLDVFGTAGANDIIRLSSSSGALGFVMGPNRALVIGGSSYYSSDNFHQFNTDAWNQNPSRSEISALDDVFISGDFEVDGILDIQDEASVGGAFEITSGYLKIPNGTVALPSLRFQSYPTTGISAPTTDVMAFSTAGIERMRITAAGNIGIAETAPAAKLEVNGDVIFRDILQAGGTATVSYSRFGTGTTGHSITGNGSVLLSTDLEVNGMSWLDGSASIGGTLELAAGTAALPSLKFTDNEGLFDAGTNILGFTTAGVERMRIDATGNIGIGTTTTTSNRMAIMGGNVSIGTTTGVAKLTLRGQTGDTAPLVSIGSLSVEALNIGKNTNIWLNPTNLGNTGIGVDVGTAPDGQLNVRAINNTVGDEKLFTIDNSSGTDYFSVTDTAASTSLTFDIESTSGYGLLKIESDWAAGIVLTGDKFGGTNPYEGTYIAFNRPTYNNYAVIGVHSLSGYLPDENNTTGGSLNNAIANAFMIVTKNATTNLVLGVSKSVDFTIIPGGNIGFGTTAPTAKFTLRAHTGDTAPLVSIGSLSVEALNIGKNTNIWLNPTNLGNTGIGVDVGTAPDGQLNVRAINNTVGDEKLFTIDNSSGTDYFSVADAGASLSVSLELGAGSAALPSLKFADNQGLFSVATNILGFSTAGTERMRIDASGNIGIGTTTTSTARLSILGTAGANKLMYVASASGTEVFTIAKNGYVGINDTTPTTTLDISGNASVSGQLELGAGTAALPSLKFADNQGLFSVATNILGFSTAGTERMRIDASGNVGIGTTTTSVHRLQVNAAADTGAGMLVTTNTAWAAGKDVSIFLGDTGHYIRGVYSSADVWSSYYGQQFANNSGTVMTVGANSTANVGIGTTGPAARLHVNGTMVIDSADVSYGEGVRINNAASGYSGIHLGGAAGSSAGTGSGIWHITRMGDSSSALRIIENTTSIMTMLPTSGYIGIGTTVPSVRLEIAGGGSLKVADEIIGGGALQMAGTATVSYSRLGTSATTHSLAASNDLLVNGMLEVDGAAWFDGAASVSSAFEVGNAITGNTPIPLTINTARTYGVTPAAGTTSLLISDSGANASQRILFKGYQGGDAAAIDQIDTGGAGALSFWTATVNGSSGSITEKMRITGSGNVGIGTTAPSAKLDVNGDVIFRDVLQVAGTATVSYSRFGTNTTGHSLSGASGVLITGDAEIDGKLWLDGGISSLSSNFDPLTDNTFSLGDPTYRWKSINIGPGSLHMSSTTGTSGAGANYTDAILQFSAGSSLSLGTQAVGTGASGSIDFRTANISRMSISSRGVTSIQLPLSSTTNVARGHRSAESSNQGSWPSTNAFDGNAGTYNATYAGVGQWLSVNLGVEQHISKIVLRKQAGTNPANYKIQTADDIAFTQNVVDIITATSETAATKTYTTADFGTTLYARNLRIITTANEFIYMSEFEVFPFDLESAVFASGLGIGGSAIDTAFEVNGPVSMSGDLVVSSLVGQGPRGITFRPIADWAAMTISSRGYVGINTTAPQAQFDAIASRAYTNIALGGRLTSTALYNPGGYPLAYLNDGNATSYGAVNTGLGSWLQVDLGERYPIGRIVLRNKFATTYPSNYKIQTADDAAFTQNVTDIITATTETATTKTYTTADFGSAVNARYVRILTTANEYIFMGEFEIYPQDTMFAVNGRGFGFGTRNIDFPFEINLPVSMSGQFTIAGNLMPKADNLYTLGSASTRWQSLYIASSSLHIGAYGNEAVIGYETSGTQGMTFKPNGSVTAMFVGDSGNVGIGTTAPVARLDVNGDVIFRDLLQAGGTATVSYSRFGTGTTGHSLAGSSDVLISDDLEVNGVLYADGGINGATQSITNITTITGTGAANMSQFIADAGTAANTAFTFEGNAGTGMFLGGNLEFAVGGTEIMSIRSDGIYADVGDVVAQVKFRIGNTGGSSIGPCGNNQYIGNGVQVVGGIITAGSCRTDDDYDDLAQHDLAETFFKMDANLEAGDLVVSYASGQLDFGVLGTQSAYQQGVIRSTHAHESGVIGVVSTNPAMTMGQGLASGTDQSVVAVALAGRVPVKVTGSVKVGDRIVASDIPGVGMKATRAGMTVGVALEPTNLVASGSIQTVIVLISPAYWAPSIQDEMAALASSGPEVIVTSEGFPMLSEMFAAIVKMFERSMNVVFENGLIRTLKGVFGEVQTDKLCVGTTCVTESQLQQLLQAQGVSPASAPASTPSPSVSAPPSTSEPPPVETVLPTPPPPPDPTPNPTPDPIVESTPQPTP